MKLVFPVLIALIIGAFSFSGCISDKSLWHSNNCLDNLTIIDLAKQEWALEQKKAGSDIPTINDLLPYLEQFPKCKKGGSYQINSVNENPTCSIGSVGHDLLIGDDRDIKKYYSSKSRSKKPTAKEICFHNLTLIQHAKIQWAFENKKKSSDTPTIEDLVCYMKEWPKCPKGGSYQINRLDTDPICSKEDKGHSLQLPPKKKLTKNEKRSRAFICIENLTKIDHAKQEWALDNKKSGTDTPTTDDLLIYLKQWPQCPEGGTYIINIIGKSPKCSIKDHILQ